MGRPPNWFRKERRREAQGAAVAAKIEPRAERRRCLEGTLSTARGVRTQPPPSRSQPQQPGIPKPVESVSGRFPVRHGDFERQRADLPGERRRAPHPGRGAARGSRADRHEGRLRRGHVRGCTVLVDGAPVLSCIPARRQVDGSASARSRATPRAASSRRCSTRSSSRGRLPVRLLHARPARLGHGAARGEPYADTRAVRHAMAGNLCRCGAYRSIEARSCAWRRRALMARLVRTRR